VNETAAAHGPREDPVDLAALRAEHDRLAQEVAARHSIDEVRKGAYLGFFSVVTGGLSVKFAWDRWGFGPHRMPVESKFPFLFFAALVLTLALAAVASLAFSRARRLMRVEDRDFARLKEVRDRLGIEA
jgi:hypothetical protein